MSIKLHLVFQDRVGIVADLSRRIADRMFNIVAMEVDRVADLAHVYLEAEHRPSGTPPELLPALTDIPGLITTRPIATLPQEEQAQRLRVVLDNIASAVIAVDTAGKVTTMNTVARKILGRENENVLGLDVRDLGLDDTAILDSLDGRECVAMKKTLATASGRLQYFATCRPIRDASGHVIGAVEIITDMREIKMLARSISEPAQISFSDIVGQNQAIINLIGYAQLIATTDSIACIRGASGTGKELFARAMHTASRRIGPFVPINCAALPEQLLESELFGYVAGAFTGGLKDGKPGLFEVAGDGTVFLDEIGDMPLSSQAKILRVMQDLRARRIGGTKEIPIRARIITATNGNLEKMVEDGTFRRDLYYRINVLPIHIPPLQERLDDIPLLAEHFLFALAQRAGRPVKTVSAAGMAKLGRHHWPGNVRELKNVVDRAAILCPDEVIDDRFVILSHELGERIPGQTRSMPRAEAGQPLKTQLDRLEKDILETVLTQARSVRQAAVTLGLSHTAILHKIKKHGLRVTRPLRVEQKTRRP
ncbi:MAG: PAS domain S-box protein [Deltaproteobacteria bacterium]|nr:PAS domain S-box protein [Deltaproteobacteria bacterium]